MVDIGNGLVSVSRLWPEFLLVVDGTEKRLSVQAEESDARHDLFAVDDVIVYTCMIFKAGHEPATWSQGEIDANTDARVELLAWTGTINAPSQATTSGGTRLVNPTIIPDGYDLYVTSAFDRVEDPALETVANINADPSPEVGAAYELSDAGNLTLGGAGTLAVVAGDKVLFEGGQWWIYTMPMRGIGAQVALEQDGPGKTLVEGQFLDHFYMLGGAVSDSASAEPGDWLSMHAYAPASAPASVTAGTGNAVKEAHGTLTRFKPDAAGDYNVDGSTLQAGEINLGLSPVPSRDKTGYWNWDPAKTPSITPVDDVSTPDGRYDLYDTRVDLVRQANRISLMIGGDITPAALRGKKILPHWVMVFTVMRAKAAGVLKATARMTTARLETF